MEYLVMLASAFGLGAAHALEPGHGKTVVAAYLVGSRGRTLDAVVLGAVVTLTHTSSVYVLALAGALAAGYLVPAQVERWLAIGSGALVTAVGAWMIYVRTRHGIPAHSHRHATHPHDCSQHDHGHDHHDDGLGHSHAAQGDATASGRAAKRRARGDVRLGSLIALGISGGIVPCPAALLLVPAALGLGEVVKGLGLVVSFSVGLALVLIAVGLVTLKATGFASGWLDRGDWPRRVSLASACLITLLGLALTVKAAASGVPLP